MTDESTTVLRQALESSTCFPAHYINEVVAVAPSLSRVRGAASWHRRMLGALQGAHDVHRDVQALLFELKTINWISKAVDLETVEYEPVGLNPSGKRTDLHMSSLNLRADLKTFHPEEIEAAIPGEHIPERNVLVMDPVTYHGIQAVRGHLIGASIDVEEKGHNYDPGSRLALIVSSDFNLTLRHFAEFVAFYHNGVGVPEDGLRDMSVHFMRQKGWRFSRTITAFWAFRFSQDSLRLEAANAVRQDGTTARLDPDSWRAGVT